MDPRITPEMIAAMRHRFGLDQPWWTQYALYLKNVVLHLDFGHSFSWHRPVFSVLRDGLVNTLALQAAAAMVTWGLAIPFGVWAAARQHSWVDWGVRAAAIATMALPELVAGLLVVMLAARTRLIPIGGMRSLDWDSLGAVGKLVDVVRHIAPPAVVIGLAAFSSHVRQVRGNLLQVLSCEYITSARAKGLDERGVVFGHGLPNALNPLITMFGLTLGGLISASLIVEVIFSWPGLGLITFAALLTQDLYLALGGIVIVSAMLVVGNLVADLLLAVVDPRIVHE